MNSFLEELEKSYELFGIADGRIIDFFHFPNDIYATWRYLLGKFNSHYFKNCQEQGKNISKLSMILVQKDESGKCYLKIVGNDNHTILNIRQNNSNFEDYRNVLGAKITEDEFKEALDYIQRKKLEQFNIPSRFLREEAQPLDICKETDVSLLISYYRYLNDYLNPVESFDEPLGTINRSPKQNESVPRKNPVIELDARKRELLKRNPKRVYRFAGSRTDSRFDAYVYERNGYTLAVVEPQSGIEYQYNLNLGMVDIKDEELIKEMIKAALESQEKIVMLDDAIMRKNHTTMDAFAKNLDIFLDGAKASNKFYDDVNKAQSVYHR